MDLQDTFISNLKRFRKEQNMTQEKLAELCKTDTSYIGQIETKKRFPSLSFVERIAASLKVEPYRLYMPQDSSNDSVSVEELKLIESEILRALKTDIKKIVKKKKISYNTFKYRYICPHLLLSSSSHSYSPFSTLCYVQHYGIKYDLLLCLLYPIHGYNIWSIISVILV